MMITDIINIKLNPLIKRSNWFKFMFILIILMLILGPCEQI
jgi:hypothetical protein